MLVGFKKVSCSNTLHGGGDGSGLFRKILMPQVEISLEYFFVRFLFSLFPA